MGFWVWPERLRKTRVKVDLSIVLGIIALKPNIYEARKEPRNGREKIDRESKERLEPVGIGKWLTDT